MVMDLEMLRTSLAAIVVIPLLLGCPTSPDPSMDATVGTDVPTGSGATVGTSDGTSSDPTAASGSGSATASGTADETGPGCETCGGADCIDTNTDPAHCGACDSPCPPGISCSEGTCACPMGTMSCGGVCVDVNADGMHCGGCDQPCEGDTVCLDGACSMSCGALALCGGGCVDTDTSALHCGGCDQPCPAGATCDGGSCACAGAAVSYAGQIEPLFVGECATLACHGGVMPQADLDLRSGLGYAALIDVPAFECGDRMRVAPGDPAGSYLLDKLLGSNLCIGTRMPKPPNPALAPDEIDMVAAWICHGALP